jgi:hypothetical protein
VVFNQQIKVLINFMIFAQLLDPANIEYASGLAYMWAGFPADSDSLLSAIEDHQIENVLVFSGDTHSSMMDNGSNSGIPELSSSGLASGGEAILNWTIDSLNMAYNGNFPVADSLWNGGGSGIGNQNFNDTYCTAEFFGKDSVRWCIIDEFDQTIACMTLPHSTLTSAAEPSVYVPEPVVRLVYPNPARNELKLQMGPGESILNQDQARIVDLEGRTVMELDVQSLRGESISLEGLAAGTYLFEMQHKGEMVRRKFVKH